MKFLAKAAAVLLVTVSLFGGSLFDNPYDGEKKSEYKYEGSSGAHYKYDLSDPSDRIEYSTDLDAQMNDKMSVSPNRDLDRQMGQFGGGIDPND
ncbi:hypothetical protein [Hydrogenimonas urashimensis]|uniref:hypothetical protein n=1 Tax=Hydrogenimonas urashimensis TaxID=2740515 RepID=UPI001916AB4C|nr:hypothetical protein [Hydrogenimonas urashimensis]